MSLSAKASSIGIETAEIAAAGTALLLLLGMGIYALGSFLLMARHTTARRFGSALRSLLRELWVVGWTQPLLPLYYLFGHRMREGTEGGVPIVFVHGYMQNRVGFLGLARALATRGLGPMFGFNYPWFTTIASNAVRLERFVQRVCEETGSVAVDLVCHSMGGLVAMEMMKNEASRTSPPPAAATFKVRRYVTIATPHAGVMWKGPLIGLGAGSLRRGSKLLEAQAGVQLSVPALSVFSSHDNIVFPKESSSLAGRGGRDVEVEGLAHLAILFSPQVAEHVASFLTEPDPV
ncbi:MAG TPA: alpha/beta fold hydrolase [Labilithrix sp.]|nr:alpha/beta fold hydrolase [Labilithrix sp.]